MGSRIVVYLKCDLAAGLVADTKGPTFSTAVALGSPELESLLGGNLFVSGIDIHGILATICIIAI